MTTKDKETLVKLANKYKNTKEGKEIRNLLLKTSGNYVGESSPSQSEIDKVFGMIIEGEDFLQKAHDAYMKARSYIYNTEMEVVSELIGVAGEVQNIYERIKFRLLKDSVNAKKMLKKIKII